MNASPGLTFVVPSAHSLPFLFSNIPMAPFLSRVRRSFFDQSCNLLRVGYVDTVTGTCDFHLVAAGSCGVLTLEFWVDGAVCSRHQHPAWLRAPRGIGDGRREVVGEVEDLRPRHQCGLVGGNVSREKFVKLLGIDVGES